MRLDLCGHEQEWPAALVRDGNVRDREQDGAAATAIARGVEGALKQTRENPLPFRKRQVGLGHCHCQLSPRGVR